MGNRWLNILFALLLLVPGVSFAVSGIASNGSVNIRQADSSTISLLECDDTTNSILFDTGVYYTNNWNFSTGTTISGTSPKFGNGACLFPNTGSIDITQPVLPTQIMAIATGNFTVDFWLKFTSMGNYGIFEIGDGGAMDNGNINLTWDNGNTRWDFAYKTGGSVSHITGTDNPTTATWYHVAVVRSATNTLTIYRDGVSKGSGSSSVDLSQGSGTETWDWGYAPSASQHFDGRLDEMRISNTARWTSGFSPSSTAYTVYTVKKALRTEFATISCSNSATNTFYYGSSGVSKVTAGSGTGQCTLNFSPAWTRKPICTCISTDTSTRYCTSSDGSNTTTTALFNHTVTSSAGDGNIYVTCVGF